MWRIGSDTGGTFTDLVSPSGQIAKVLSTPDNPARAVASGIEQLLQTGQRESASTQQLEELTHGTTVATNALLERKGARVAFICNEGFSDIIEIARQDRPSLYDPFIDRPAPLVSRPDRLEVPGRLDAQGKEIAPLELDKLPQMPSEIEAVAVCLLHSDLYPSHEIALRDHLVQATLDIAAASNIAAAPDITCSHEIAPEFREYERASTTVLNSYLRPRCRTYLRNLSQLARQVLVMTSAGGLLPALQAAEAPARLLLSGPAGGVRAASYYATANGFANAVTLDMGGTSTDVCLVLGGQPAPAELAELLEMETVVIPPRAGALSAVGILGAPRQVDLVSSWGAVLDHQGAQAQGEKLRQQAQAQLPEADEIVVSYDCRYSGQSHEIQVPSPELFHQEHRRQNGYSRQDTSVEVTAVRCIARVNLEVPLPDIDREAVSGPAVIAEADTTIWVAENWSAELGEASSLILRRS